MAARTKNLKECRNRKLESLSSALKLDLWRVLLFYKWQSLAVSLQTSCFLSLLSPVILNLASEGLELFLWDARLVLFVINDQMQVRQLLLLLDGRAVGTGI